MALGAPFDNSLARKVAIIDRIGIDPCAFANIVLENWKHHSSLAKWLLSCWTTRFPKYKYPPLSDDPLFHYL